MFKSNPRFGFWAVGIGLVMLSARLQASELPPVAPISEQRPDLDGRINTAEWKDALYLGELPGELPKTEAWVLLTRTHLYVAVRCAEPMPDQIRAVTLGDEIKGKVWMDDSVEVFIDTQNLGKSIFRLVANSEGTLFDSQIVNLQQVTEGWTSNAQARAHVGKEGWEIEVAIPMETMGHRLTHGEVFSMNVGRNRQVTGKAETASFAGPRFIFPQQFQRLLAGGPIQGKGFSLLSTRRGPFLTKSGGGSWEFELLSGEVKEEAFQFPQGGKVLGARFGKRYLTIPFKDGEEGAMRECRIDENGSALFSSSYTVQKPMRVVRVTPTRKPIFEPLLEAVPDGLAKDGVINWGHEFVRPSIRVLPLRTGMAYRHEETPFENYRRDRTSIINKMGGLQQRPDVVELTKKYDINWVIYLGGRRPDGVPVFDKPGKKGAVWSLDPRMKQSYLESTRRAIDFAKEHGNVGWFFAGDETWEHMHSALLRALDEKDSYPELKAADAEIREKYGFGKWGLPESATDTNPYRWIATYRWEVDQMMALAKEVRAMMKKDAPGVKFLSWDCMTGHRPYAVGKWGEVFDAITAQIYPSQGNGRDHSGFTTKFYADLSGSKEIWPVPHIEHYPASFTAEEVEEILSATFRMGATGLHLWTADFYNEAMRRKGSSVVDRIGAPERWNVIRSVIDRLPFRVKQPEPDAAIFYSNTSYQATGAPMTYSVNNHNEWLYSVLGPQLGMAFRFVDDLSVPAKPESLKGYKAVFIPYMPIADDPEYDALEAYAKAGGTVVVCDPLSFRHRSDGSKRESGGLLAPLTSENAETGQAIVLEDKRRLPSLGDRYRLDDPEGTVMARYTDGQAALLERRVGDGRVIFFAGSPLVAGLVNNKEWISYFGGLRQELGLSGNHDVWRFRFPEAPQPEQPRPEGVCLTGNYFRWSLSEPKPEHNSLVKGRYTVRGARTLKAEPAGTSVEFVNGRLTDRITGANAPTTAKGEEFILPCRSDEPWSVTFEFDASVKAHTARLFFMGRLPAGVCEISADGQEWKPVGKWESRTAEGSAEVALEQMTLEAGSARQVRFHFDSTADQRFVLVEADLWGSEE